MQLAMECDVSQRVATGVAILGRVGHFADANAVENDPNHPPETHFVFAESASRVCIRLVICSRNVAGSKPSMRLAMRPLWSIRMVLGIFVTFSRRERPSSKYTVLSHFSAIRKGSTTDRSSSEFISRNTTSP